MAKYKLLEKAFIDNRIYEPGEVVEVPDSVTPGPFMKPADAAAQKRAKEVGLVLGPMPDPVDQLTTIPRGAGLETIGASPQDVKSGMAAVAK
ncbi:MAG: hypothetical protein M0Z81_04025 [Deltaproteobacteria bacterium]|jgi:hypothetical protein|nr:hypothetical protein [Deltaproteobacteria bacterium]